MKSRGRNCDSVMRNGIHKQFDVGGTFSSRNILLLRNSMIQHVLNETSPSGVNGFAGCKGAVQMQD